MEMSAASVRSAVADAVEAYLAAVADSVNDDATERAAAALLPAVVQPENPAGLVELVDAADTLAGVVADAARSAEQPALTLTDVPAPGGPNAVDPDIAVRAVPAWHVGLTSNAEPVTGCGWLPGTAPANGPRSPWTRRRRRCSRRGSWSAPRVICWCIRGGPKVGGRTHHRPCWRSRATG